MVSTDEELVSELESQRKTLMLDEAVRFVGFDDGHVHVEGGFDAADADRDGGFEFGLGDLLDVVTPGCASRQHVRVGEVFPQLFWGMIRLKFA